MDQATPGSTRRIFDWSINVQGMLAGIVGATLAIAFAWFQLVGQVEKLKDKEVSQDERMSRIEKSVDQQRDDMKQQLRDIGGNVRDTNAKIDQLRDMLIQNSAGSRSDIKRWSR